MTLVFYDGPCGLCSRAVRWLARRDRRRALAFAPLQGEEGAPYRAAAGMRGEVDVPDTVVVVERTGGAERVTTARRGGWRGPARSGRVGARRGARGRGAASPRQRGV